MGWHTVSGTQARSDPTGDLRGRLLALLEYDLMPWSDRAAITYSTTEPIETATSAGPVDRSTT